MIAIISLAGIVFTNILKNPILERIAEADEFGVVVCVREVFSDFYVLHKNHVNLKLGTVIGEQLNSWSRPSLSRAASGLSALLLCLHQRPVIRFDRSSLMANQLAHELDQLIESEGDLYQPCHTDSRPLVLVLDRRFDLITPLLLQWSYQAMVHDLFGIENGRVRVKDDNTGNTKEFVFSVYQDDFLKDNSDSSFGDLGANVRTLVQTFQGRTQLHQTQMDSLPSMKHFIEEYPEYRKMSFYVSKHVSLLGELSRKVESLQLLRISELQQIIATSKVNDAKLLDQISLFLQEEDICSSFKLNISILCALHHRRWPNFDFLKFVDILRRCGMSEEHVSVILLWDINYLLF